VPGEPFPLLTTSLTEAPLQPSAHTASGIAVLAREAEDHLLTSHNLNYTQAAKVFGAFSGRFNRLCR
jgi:hypothetical protein